MRKKRKHPFLIFLLWCCFLAMAGLACYLSFQSGEETRLLGRRLAEYLVKLLRHISEGSVPESIAGEEIVKAYTYEVRQFGRIVLFFLLGVTGTLAFHLSFRKWNRFLRTVLTIAVLLMLACLTEKLKIYIPGRHYSNKEMAYSIFAAGMGFFTASFFLFINSAFRRAFRCRSRE